MRPDLTKLRAMARPTMSLIPTRESLLSRLRDWADDESWSEFFHTYWRMLYEVALRAGLREEEAQEAVQETVIAVARKMPGFHYDPALGSFKGWLLRIARRRIVDQFRKRGSRGGERAARTRSGDGAESVPTGDDTGEVGTRSTASPFLSFADGAATDALPEADPYYLAWIEAGLNQWDEALATLDKAVDFKSVFIVHPDFGGLRTDPAWDGLRNDPRFEALCQTVGMGKDQWPR
jgi:RNA polymerase sigma factor (sigma-70 family)